MSDKLQDTLSALRRGENPPCPWCGSDYLTCHQDETQEIWFAHEWKCETLLSNSEDWNEPEESEPEEPLPRFIRDARCYDRELSALRARVDVLTGEHAKLREAAAKGYVGA